MNRAGGGLDDLEHTNHFQRSSSFLLSLLSVVLLHVSSSVSENAEWENTRSCRHDLLRFSVQTHQLLLIFSKGEGYTFSILLKI